MFSLMGRFTYRRRWAVLLVTALAVPLAGLWGAGVFGALSTSGYDAPGTETARANALLRLWTQVTEVSVFALQITVLLGLGLAIDYGLFVVGRFRDELSRTGDTARSVAVALQQTVGVVSGAALLMVVVLATTGIVSDSLVITTLGIGLSIALILDATLVRALLVPASMRLLGHANWWPAR